MLKILCQFSVLLPRLGQAGPHCGTFIPQIPCRFVTFPVPPLETSSIVKSWVRLWVFFCVCEMVFLSDSFWRLGQQMLLNCFSALLSTSSSGLLRISADRIAAGFCQLFVLRWCFYSFACWLKSMDHGSLRAFYAYITVYIDTSVLPHCRLLISCRFQHPAASQFPNVFVSFTYICMTIDKKYYIINI